MKEVPSVFNSEFLGPIVMPFVYLLLKPEESAFRIRKFRGKKDMEAKLGIASNVFEVSKERDLRLGYGATCERNQKL